MKVLPPLLLFVAALIALPGCVQTGVAQKSSSSSRKTVVAKRESATVANTSNAPKTIRVRTTAYIGKKNAIGGPLKHGPVISAASDWSEFPLGTRFRVRETGKQYVIDDYGSALVGTRTIDLAKPHPGAMNRWGARWVHIDILEWGSSRRSLEILTPRQNYRHIRPMVAALRQQTGGIPKEFHRVD